MLKPTERSKELQKLNHLVGILTAPRSPEDGSKAAESRL